MTAMLDNLFSSDKYVDAAARDRARLIYGFTLVMLVLFLTYALVGTYDAETNDTLLQRAAIDFVSLLSIVSMLVVGSATLLLTRAGRSDLSAYGPVIMWLLSGVALGYQAQFVTPDAGAALLILILIASLFLRVRGFVIGLVVALVTLLVAVVNYTPNTMSQVEYLSDISGLVVELLGASALIYLFLRSARIDQRTSAAVAYEDRFRLANITTQIAQRIQRRTQLGDLLNSAIADILASYTDVYHAQIFLLDDAKRDAVLAASTGTVGATLLQRNHKLPVGSHSVIGQVTANGNVIVARSGSSESVHRRNEFLPDTVVEAAFPLKLGDAVIGALDLQSRSMQSFSEDDLPVFQSLADNIAVAIDNARLFEQTETRVRENQRLVEQTRGAMREVERLNSQLTRQAWTEYLDDQQNSLNVDVDFERDVSQRSQVWTPTLNEAINFNRLVEHHSADQSILTVPLRVRGQVIGAIEFELDDAPSPEDIDLVQAVTERFSLAVENARLYEETRQAAEQEQRINDIASRFQSVATVDELLQITLTELSATLGAEGGTIRLGRLARENGETHHV